MPESISIAPNLGHSQVLWHGCGWSNTATSPAVQITNDAVAALVESRERSEFLFGRKADAIASLNELARECADDDWDGNDSLAVTPAAVWNAERFIRALADDFPMPEVSAEPDGAISLDWIVSRNRMLSLSVGQNNRLALAWLDGTERGHAVLSFDGVHTPTRFDSEISQLLKYAKPSLGSA